MSGEPQHAVQPAAPARRIGAPQNLAAGFTLLVVAAIALWAGAGLDAGRLRAMGPGMLPRALALLVGGAGALLVGSAFVKEGEPIGRWRLRGPLLVTIAILAFAATIRTAGLAVAGPLVVVIGGAAAPDARPRELAVFAVLLTALCVGLFRYALGLPIPVLRLPGIVTL
ncbi:tripartite tricarboxylate transporter TctB family protein [Anaeromyxobacter oryzae]|uniref:DUF1468 domain-containing protein n=1 Tax=Anaeromyxobacter oryzae TaxID=2918170 RepID=A0ABN6MVN6_9BACT|nr:tripartite tricarboxylate transporter TctB family protein [Anaeromyxobacter oryzae]BDG03892.1 hypothetical protein AMOR_28880 [Anaeromyxobacter oryzae]